MVQNREMLLLCAESNPTMLYREDIQV
jgi:hypothetical protein